LPILIACPDPNDRIVPLKKADGTINPEYFEKWHENIYETYDKNQRTSASNALQVIKILQKESRDDPSMVNMWNILREKVIEYNERERALEQARTE
jgi:hypothetical protein